MFQFIPKVLDGVDVRALNQYVNIDGFVHRGIVKLKQQRNKHLCVGLKQ